MDPLAHDEVISRSAEHLAPLLGSSSDGVDVRLDETHQRHVVRVVSA
jgi:hypothetical protein